MMMKKVLLLFAAVCCAFTLAACCSTEDAPVADDAPVAAELSAAADEATAEETPAVVFTVHPVDDDVFDALMGDQAVPEIEPVQAEMLCKEDFQTYFTVTSKVVFETDPDGVRYARLRGRMNELPFWEWLVTDEGPRPYRYRFILTGKDGIRTLSPVQTRMITPGDATRFSVKVPADCTAAVLLLDDAE